MSKFKQGQKVYFLDWTEGSGYIVASMTYDKNFKHITEFYATAKEVHKKYDYKFSREGA